MDPMCGIRFESYHTLADQVQVLGTEKRGIVSGSQIKSVLPGHGKPNI